MRNIMLTISYDGSLFFGFQKQKNWEYKDEETLESDGFDIFDSMFENFGK